MSTSPAPLPPFPDIEGWTFGNVPSTDYAKLTNRHQKTKWLTVEQLTLVEFCRPRWVEARGVDVEPKVLTTWKKAVRRKVGAHCAFSTVDPVERNTASVILSMHMASLTNFVVLSGSEIPWAT